MGALRRTLEHVGGLKVTSITPILYHAKQPVHR